MLRLCGIACGTLLTVVVFACGNDATDNSTTGGKAPAKKQAKATAKTQPNRQGSVQPKQTPNRQQGKNEKATVSKGGDSKSKAKSPQDATKKVEKNQAAKKPTKEDADSDDSKDKSKKKKKNSDVSDLIVAGGATWTLVAKGESGARRFKFTSKGGTLYNMNGQPAGQIGVVSATRANIHFNDLPLIGTLRATKVRNGEWGGKLKGSSGEFDANIYRDGMLIAPKA